MEDNNTVFDDIMQALHEVEEHQKGNIQLNSNIVSIPDDEIEANQVISRQIRKLSNENKQKVMQYTAELLQASS